MSSNTAGASAEAHNQLPGVFSHMTFDPSSSFVPRPMTHTYSMPVEASYDQQPQSYGFAYPEHDPFQSQSPVSPGMTPGVQASTPAYPPVLHRASTTGPNPMQSAYMASAAAPIRSSRPQMDVPAGVSNFIGKFDMIRLGVEAAGGRGSVSSSMEMLKTLISMTPADIPIQVIYEKPHTKKTSSSTTRTDDPGEKLEQLLGKHKFSNKYARQSVNFHGREIKFIHEGYLDDRDDPQGRILGMVGANDAPDHHVSRWGGILGSEDAGTPSIICTGQPKDFPYAGPPSVYIPAAPMKPGMNPRYLRDIPTGYPSHTPELDNGELRDLLAQLPDKTAADRNRASTLGHIFQLLHDDKIDVIPVYGLHHPKMKQFNRDEDLITSICGGVQLARNHKTDPIEKKPTVIALIGAKKDIDDYEHSSFLKAFFGSSSKKEIYNPDAICSASSSATAGNLKKLRKNEIMLLNVGILDETMFSQLTIRANHPPFFEGANSTDKYQKFSKDSTVYVQMLAAGTKLPNAEEYVSDQGQISVGRDHSVKLSETLTQPVKSAADYATIRKGISKVLRENRDPASATRQYFGRVSEKAREENQVIDLIYKASSHLRTMKEGEPDPVRVGDKVVSKLGITYSLWSDGDIAYELPRDSDEDPLHVLDRDILTSTREFSRNHWEDYRDLRVVAISERENGKPLFTMVGPSSETYHFSFDESKQQLTLIQKNQKKMNEVHDMDMGTGDREGFDKAARDVAKASRKARERDKQPAKKVVHLDRRYR